MTSIQSNATSLAGQRAIKVGVQLRFLRAEDKPRVKELCRKFFPIDYPERWYNDITQDKRYFALSAVFQGIIVGVIVAEVKSKFLVNKDDQDILSSNTPVDTKVAYLLSLGVLSEYRENGIGSLLIDSLITELRGKDKSSIKAVYLHVLCSNLGAIRFYERREFLQHKLIPGYYSINNQQEDGFCYVRYINGGQPPWSVGDYMRQVTSMFTKINTSCSGSGSGPSPHRSGSSPTQTSGNTNKSSSGAPASVSAYASSLVSKIPKLLPSGLPKLPSLFSSSSSSSSPPPAASQEEKSRKTSNIQHEQVVIEPSDPKQPTKQTVTIKPTVDASPKMGPPTANVEDADSLSCYSNDSIGSHVLHKKPESASLSSEEEFHDSISSPSQLTQHELEHHLPGATVINIEESNENDAVNDTTCITQAIKEDKTPGKSGNPVTSLGNSLQSKLKTLYPSSKKSNSTKLSKMMTITSNRSRSTKLKRLKDDCYSSGDEDFVCANDSAVKKYSKKRSSSLASKLKDTFPVNRLGFPSSETHPILDDSGFPSSNNPLEPRERSSILPTPTAISATSWAGPKNAWETR